MSGDAAQSKALFGRMLDGAMSDGEIEAVLVALADKGESAQDLVGAVLAMRERMVRVVAPAAAIDVCGTGGDGQHSLNISTAVAIIVAACGVPVAKHGNRAASSKAGAADTLEALGLDLEAASTRAEATLEQLGIAFLFAQAHHPAMRHVAPIRRKLARRTIFNLIGPLANPAGVTRQLVGVAQPEIVALYAQAMAILGTDAALIVSGEEGLDELSIEGPTLVAQIGLPGMAGQVTPEFAGLVRHPLDMLRGGDPAYNAAALKRLLSGETGAYRDAVLLNSAGALIVAGEAADWRDGAMMAAEAIDDGRAASLLDRWIEASR
jgi:anthranilate phosphoribosyltransferase